MENVNLLEYDKSISKELVVLDKLKSNLSILDQQYLVDNGKKYIDAYNGIQDLVKNGTLVTSVPIKLQTLAEKRKIIKNFDQCVETYNIWVEENNLGQKYTDSELKLISNQEVNNWYKDVPKTLLLE